MLKADFMAEHLALTDPAMVLALETWRRELSVSARQ